MPRPELLTTARVWGDGWSGSAAAAIDESALGTDLHACVGLDPDKWWIVAVDFLGSDWDYGEVRVYAVDRRAHGVDDWDGLQLLAEANGTVPVTRFYVRGLAPSVLLADVFRDLHVQLRLRDIDRELLITDSRELSDSGA